MEAFAATDIGRVRTENQDSIFSSVQKVGHLPNLFLIADGMGGHKGGAHASQSAVNIICDSIAGNEEYNPIKVMRQAIEGANHKLYMESRQDAELAQMGTTVVAMTVVGGYAYIANVGDSRMYLIGKGIYQVTADHSYVQEMVRKGQITNEEAEQHPGKNYVTRVVGTEREVKVDFFEIKIEQGEYLLLCSDGLTNMLSNTRIHQILTTDERLETKINRLIAEANERGGLDNISVIVVSW
ncbi:MAG: Stp1/IreP family PP2C-type Ser/Thr phosphatase [Lachnospiraceae bacterium]|nr:Stp1/IreP family PP2C-type Ser/Thr phosphatase [Lachnospiraceae bacterium]